MSADEQDPRSMREEVAFRNAVDPSDAASFREAGWWGDATLVDYMWTHVAAKPNSPAFIGDDGTLTWADLDSASTNVGAAMIGLGLEPGARVACLLPGSPTMHAVYLGLEKAGIVVVGIGYRAGDREIAHLINSTGATALITMENHRDRSATDLQRDLRQLGVGLDHHVTVPAFERHEGDPILVDGAGAATASELDLDFEARRMGPDDLFLINSTSGTTGLPKCVLHHQNRWLYFHKLAVENGEFQTDEVMLSAAPLPFGFGLWTAHFTPIVLGAPSVVSGRFDAGETLRQIEEHRVTLLACVSTQFLMMLNEADFDRRDLTSLRTMFTGGEAVPTERARDFEERSGCCVLQFYGSNETGVLSGTRRTDSLELRLTTAGQIIPEMHVRLFDTAGAVETTEEGRPACKGPATCLGYLERAANAQLFTEDGWMLMGDICSIDDSGYLTVTGRISDFIIRGGKNISASEVEDEVSTHPSVAIAAAVAMPDELFGERVCVYVELHPDSDPLGFEDLAAHLEARGTSKEIRPEALVVMDALPRSSGGKVAKGELSKEAAQR